MSPTNRHKYKYFHSTVQRAKDRGQKFHFCRLTYDHVTSNLISLLRLRELSVTSSSPVLLVLRGLAPKIPAKKFLISQEEVTEYYLKMNFFCTKKIELQTLSV